MLQRSLYALTITTVALSFQGCGQPAAPKESADSEAETAASESASPPAIESVETSSEPEVVSVEEIFVLPADDGKPLTVEEIEAFVNDPANHRPILPDAPVGLEDPANHIPEDNPLTRAKVELGRLLYFDKRLSLDETVSCASCHHPDKGWTDQAPVSTGIDGQTGGRSAPTVVNRLYGKTQFWDGRAASLEEQSLGPIENPIEMGFTHEAAVERLKGIEGYRIFFEKVFGDVTPDNIAKAIASFERTVLVGGAPNDYYERAQRALELGEEELAELDEEVREQVKQLIADYKEHELSEAALRGRELYFKKAECSLCHVGPNLSDELFYNIGVGMDKDEPDAGRVAVSTEDKDHGAFKTPSLRNIKNTAPYMHDGSQKTLMEVVKWYNQGGHPHSHLHKRIKKLNLTEEEMKDLVVFLEEGLTGPEPHIVAPRLP